MGQDRIFRREEFRLDEEIAKSRMGGVGLRGGQHNFGVTGQLNFARAHGIIRQRNAPHLGVILGRYDNLHVRHNAGIVAPEIRFVLGKCHFIRLRPFVNGLIAGRPDRSAAHVS